MAKIDLNKEPENERFKVEITEIQRLLKALGNHVASTIPKRWGFTLLLSSTSEEGEDPGSTFYISNLAREDNVGLLRETADEIENDK